MAQAILTRIDGREFRDPRPQGGPLSAESKQQDPAESLVFSEKKGSTGEKKAMRGKGSLSLHVQSPSSVVSVVG